ncbi:hypothetical protein [Actinoallomurus rhizosphaericola]|uniref:hypothetical protein n=1 Tax=Actinoallomurus rhizosphaericola TaxID=2952536 RepID=UPI002093FBD2|nr:hypothetical protein [Actinoallomurus rhizosphaericola]MCO5996662.1 hypothetical protein [Actinoallomurus rhizosphaericola]
MTADSVDLLEQSRLVLTAHPLQRIGAYATAALAGDTGPEELPAEDFERAVQLMTRQAINAALVRDSKAAHGFWLKTSYSINPNSPMNHPSNGKKSADSIRTAIEQWRSLPDPRTWPGVDCVLCGRAAVGFFGKLDVPLAESDAYRNSTPRGHAGLALCRPCLVSFHALAYGSHLTGGSCYALHSWDGRFMRRTVERQVDRNKMIAETGKVSDSYAAAREVVAFRALRRYGERLTAGVELLVFNNNNRGQSLEIHALDQPLAEWLRRTLRPANRPGFKVLVQAHASARLPGVVALARNAFTEPSRIVGAVAAHLGRLVALTDRDREQVSSAVGLLYSFVTEVMQMDAKDLAELQSTARKVAGLLSVEESGGKLNALRACMRDPRKLRAWLTRHGVRWAMNRPDKADGPLVSERAFVLLFDPAQDNPGWFHRDVFLIGVLEELTRLGWRSKTAEEDLQELDDSTDKEFTEKMEEEQ